MAIATVCECGKTYQFKNEYAGRRVKCPACGGAMDVPAPLVQADPAFDRDKFLLRQKRLAISEKYYIWDENDQTILFVERPARIMRNLAAIFAAVVVFFVVIFAIALPVEAMKGRISQDLEVILMFGGFFAAIVIAVAVAILIAPKRHVTFYRSEDKAERLLEILQDSKWQIPTASYTVLDAEGQPMAKLYKNYIHNVIRKRWRCISMEGEPICTAKEDSILMSLMRRFGPFGNFMRTNFVLYDGDVGSEEILGEFNRKFTIFDRYVLDMSQDSTRKLDRRLAVAIGVMLDTGERR